MFCGTIHTWRKDLVTGVPTVVQVTVFVTPNEECNIKIARHIPQSSVEKFRACYYARLV